MEKRYPKIYVFDAIKFGFKTFFKSPIFILVVSFIDMLTNIVANFQHALYLSGASALILWPVGIFMHILALLISFFIFYCVTRISFCFYDGVSWASQSYFDRSRQFLRYLIVNFVYFLLFLFLSSTWPYYSLCYTIHCIKFSFPFSFLVPVLAVLTLLLMIILWFAPYFVVDQDVGVMRAFKKSLAVSFSGFVNVALLILFFVIITFLLEYIKFEYIKVVYDLLGSALNIIMIISGVCLYRKLVPKE